MKTHLFAISFLLQVVEQEKQLFLKKKKKKKKNCHGIATNYKKKVFKHI